MTDTSTSPPSASYSPVHGRLVAKYLQENENGATVADIVHHLRDELHCNQPSVDLNRTVETILADGTTLGFLERKGSKFMCWIGKEACGFRRRSRCRRRRRRRSRCRRRRRQCRCKS